MLTEHLANLSSYRELMRRSLLNRHTKLTCTLLKVYRLLIINKVINLQKYTAVIKLLKTISSIRLRHYNSFGAHFVFFNF